MFFKIRSVTSEAILQEVKILLQNNLTDSDFEHAHYIMQSVIGEFNTSGPTTLLNHVTNGCKILF